MGHFEGYFGYHFGTEIGPRGAKMGPREPSRPPSSEKVEGSKRANGSHFVAFWTSKTAPRGPKKPSKRHLNRSKTSQKGDQKWTQNLEFFGTTLEPFWDRFGAQNWPKSGQKISPKLDLILDRLPPPLRGRDRALQAKTREWSKSDCS